MAYDISQEQATRSDSSAGSESLVVEKNALMRGFSVEKTYYGFLVYIMGMD
jgi:hypothetical protein